MKRLAQNHLLDPGAIRIIKAGFRPGDKADMAFVEWVDRSSEDAETDVPELKESEAG